MLVGQLCNFIAYDVAASERYCFIVAIDNANTVLHEHLGKRGHGFIGGFIGGNVGFSS